MPGKRTVGKRTVERTSRNNSLALLLLLLLSAACSQPESGYRFVSAETAAAQDGSYRFDLLLDDTTAVYRTSIAARIVGSQIPEAALDLDITLTAPDGETSIERCSLPLTEAPGVRIALGSGSVADFEWPWRTFRAEGGKAGRWQIAVSPARTDDGKALYGIGLSYTAKPWEKAN